VKDLKQKRLIYDATEELKLEILAQRDENTSLAKENKALKEELRNTLRKEEETE
jgi:regulator of replication initiation timing